MSRNSCLCYTCTRVNHILCFCSHLKCSPDFTYPSFQGPLQEPAWRFLSTQLFLFLLWSFRAINVCASQLTSWLHPASWGDFLHVGFMLCLRWDVNFSRARTVVQLHPPWYPGQGTQFVDTWGQRPGQVLYSEPLQTSCTASVHAWQAFPQ